MSDETIKWIYGTGSAFILALLGYFLNKRLKKKEQESNKVGTDLVNFKTIVEIYDTTVEELRKEVGEVRDKLDKLATEFQQCSDELKEWRKKIESNGVK